MRLTWESLVLSAAICPTSAHNSPERQCWWLIPGDCKAPKGEIGLVPETESPPPTPITSLSCVMSAKHAASRVVGEVVCARSGQKGAAVLRLFFHISVEAAGGSSTA